MVSIRSDENLKEKKQQLVSWLAYNQKFKIAVYGISVINTAPTDAILLHMILILFTAVICQSFQMTFQAIFC